MNLLRKLTEEAPPVVAAALLAEIFVPRLGSPLRELPYFFALWASSSFVWSALLAAIRSAIDTLASERLGPK